MKILSLFDGMAWRDVPGYEGIYRVSKSGEVVRVSKNRALTPKIERNGYVRVRLSKGGVAESVLLHRIVASAWVENPGGHPTVNHIDEDKTNNHADNLEWCDMSYQNSYGNGAIARDRAKERPVSQWDKDGSFIRNWKSVKSAATALGLSESSIACVCDGKRRYKSTGGWVFKRENEVGHGN